MVKFSSLPIGAKFVVFNDDNFDPFQIYVKIDTYFGTEVDGSQMTGDMFFDPTEEFDLDVVRVV